MACWHVLLSVELLREDIWETEVRVAGVDRESYQSFDTSVWKESEGSGGGGCSSKVQASLGNYLRDQIQTSLEKNFRQKIE